VHKGRRFDDIDEFLGFRLGAFVTGQGQHKAEFIPAQTADRIGLSHMGGQQARDVMQCSVAGSVAVCVVDFLEAVQVHIDQRGRRFVTFGQGQGLGDLAQEGAAVQHRQQDVVIGQGF
jgi:hypothetical protein